jgi:uncharacterized protein (TIGR02271 family)
VGAVAGSATGGLVAGLVKTHHMDAEDAQLYAEGVRRGETLLTVQVEDAEVSRTRDLLNQYNPTDVHGEATSWRSQGWSRFDESSTPTTEEYQTYRTSRSSSSTGLGASATPTTRTEDGKMVLPVVEEQVDVSKREVEKGRVHVYTEVTERPVSTDVSLRQENVTVERRPADRPVSSADAAFREQDIELTEKSEQAVINKSARVVEEVVVGKDVTQQSQTVSDTVRRTDVHVERDDSGFNNYDTHFRSDYQTRYGNMGRSYDVYMPAYQYGYTLASDPNYSNQDWSAFESNARSQWEREHPDTLWEDIKDAARYAWDTVRGRR